MQWGDSVLKAPLCQAMMIIRMMMGNSSWGQIKLIFLYFPMDKNRQYFFILYISEWQPIPDTPMTHLEGPVRRKIKNTYFFLSSVSQNNAQTLQWASPRRNLLFFRQNNTLLQHKRKLASCLAQRYSSVEEDAIYVSMPRCHRHEPLVHV